MCKLPKDGRSQEIGRLAGRALGIKLPKSWIEKELDGDSDFGIDYLIQLKNSDNYVNFSFYLQLKGTTLPSYSSSKEHISYDFKVSTLKYYHNQEPLIMVAVVDLNESEDKLWESTIYYFWLDEEWFSDNKDKLDSQKTVSIKIPTSQILNQSLDVYDYYTKRIEEKFAFAELKSEIKSHNENFVQSIGSLAETISDKPVFLKTIENSGDEPWIENPTGEFPTLLKQCSDSLNTNRLIKATEILIQLKADQLVLSPHELAEYYYQKAVLYSLHGDYIKSNKNYAKATKISDKDRYKLGYIESKFKLDKLPDESELIELAESLSSNDYWNACVKAKCLALLGRDDDAIKILEVNFPNKIVGQLMVLMISNNLEKIDLFVKQADVNSLENDRDKYIYHSLLARRLYGKANHESITHGEVVPIQGKVGTNSHYMKESFSNLCKAWDYAKRLGYSSDITLLFDISPSLFGFYNCMDDLFYHLEQLLIERPKHEGLIKVYTRLLFNNGDFEKVIELLNRISCKLDIDDHALLLLSNYYLLRFREVQIILKEKHDSFIEEQPENLALIFCIGAEIAQDELDEELAKQYLEIVKGCDSGEALISINDFMRKSRKNPNNRESYINDLYNEYTRTGKPLVIAEQLFKFLNPHNLASSHKIIDLSNTILLAHDLFEVEYMRLAHALITNNEHDKALEISEKHISKEKFDPDWHIIKVICLQKKGKLGLAYQEIKVSLEQNQYSSEHLKQFVNICFKFGLFTEVQEALVDLLDSAEKREDKLLFLSNLISIYSSDQNYSDKLIRAIKKFGMLVDRSDPTEEGQFLFYFLMSPKNEDPNEIKEFQERLANYTATFPDSHILKQTTIDVDSGSEALLSSINSLAGITDEQIDLWKKNKNRIRNGDLPVPFIMLERFLSDTRDLFTTWFLANNTPEDKLEFKLRQAPQLEQEKFESIILEKKSVIIEDSSLLILNEINVLDKFLEQVDELCLLESTFERISKSNDPLAGLMYSYIPQQILKIINNHKAKLRIISEEGSDLISIMQKEISENNSILLTDDTNLLRLVLIGQEQLSSANSYNVIEYLFNRSELTEMKKYNSISKVCSFGIYQPNMTLNLLADSFVFYTGGIDDTYYDETGFKSIFEKIFSPQRDTISAVLLFLNTIVLASENKNYHLNSNSLLSLFKGLLLRHHHQNLESFSSFWFIYSCMNTRVVIESELTLVSSRHVKLWQVYKEIIQIVEGKELNIAEMHLHILNQIFLLDEEPKNLAYHHIKTCFIPLSEEAELFESMYKKRAINQQIMRS